MAKKKRPGGITKQKRLRFEQRATEQLIDRLKNGGVPDNVARTVAETVVKTEADNIAKAQEESKARGTGRNTAQTKTEDVQHEEAAALILGMADPYAVMKDVAVASGMHPATAHQLMERMRTKYLPVREVTKAYDNNYYISQIEEKMAMCLNYMDDFAFANASLRDIATAFGILSEHRRLMNDEPTVILGVQDRKNLNDLLPMVAAEAARRGITIDAQAEEVKAIGNFDRKVLDATYRRAEQGVTKSLKGITRHAAGKG